MANFDFIGDDGALFVAHGFDFGDGKAAIAKIGKSALESLVQLVLKGRSLLRGSENAGVDAVFLAMATVGEEEKLDL